MGKEKQIYKKDPETICKVIDNESVIIPLGKEVGINDLGFFYILKNEVATYIWELIDGKKDIGRIKKLVLDNFDVDATKAQKDIKTFIAKLEKIKAIHLI